MTRTDTIAHTAVAAAGLAALAAGLIFAGQDAGRAAAVPVVQLEKVVVTASRAQAGQLAAVRRVTRA